MKLHHILTETTEEDRALISLANAIQNRAKAGQSISGTIGQMFDTPLTALTDIELIVSNEENDSGLSDRAFDGAITYGYWDEERKAIVLNQRFVGQPLMRTKITHELRHALDDLKSDFKASGSDRYFSPIGNQDSDETAYLATPAEINARFSEVLHMMTGVIRKLVREQTPNVRERAIEAFNKLLERKRIAELFPERTESRAFKRLLKRGVDMINKELAYRAAD